MGRHLPAVRRRIALRHVVEGELLGGHAAAEDEAAVAVVGREIIVGLKLARDCGESLVAAARHVEVPLALAVEVLLAQVAMAALEDGEQQLTLELRGKDGRGR